MDKFLKMLTLPRLVLFSILLRLPSLAIPFWNKDEGWNAARAITQAAGGRFYIDAYDHKTPLLYYLHGWVFALFHGHWRMFVIRCCFIAAIVATGLAIYTIGKRLAGRRAGLAAFFFFTVFQMCWVAGETYYAGTENFMNAPLAWAVAFFLMGSAATDLLAGVCIGLGVLFRNSAVPDLGIMLGYLFLAAWAQHAWRRHLWRGVRIVIGCAIPCCITYWYLSASGTLAAAKFWNLEFIRLFLINGPGIGEVIFRGVTKTAEIVGSQLLLYALAAIGVVGLVRSARRDGWRAAVEHPACYPALWLLSGASVILAGGRFSTHYYFQLFPALSVLAGLALARSLESWRGSPIRRRLIVVGILLPLIGFSWEVPYRIGQYYGWIPAQRPAQAIAAYVREQTAPSDRILVWGYLPDVYYYADRVSATKFHTVTHLTGQIREEMEYAQSLPQLQRLWSDFWDEMRAHPPVLFIDAARSRIVSGRYMHGVERYPALQQWLEKNYHYVTEIHAARIYRKR